MNHLGAFAAALFLIGAVSGSSLWSRNFDPDLVERPIEEYKELYRRHLLETRQNKECTAEEIAACKDSCPGWTLVNGAEGDHKCAPIGGHETESVFYVPDKAKPCCKYHGCVVADCKKLTADFRYDATKKCTVDNTPKGKEDPCKHRVKKKTCGCTVEECEEKGCGAPPECAECHVLVPKPDQCGCLTNDSCVLEEPEKEKATCDKKTKCDKCFGCKKEKIFGDKCAKKYPKLDKSYCERLPCPPPKECSACQIMNVKEDDGCGCMKITCQDPKGPAKCMKPDAKTGKCADDCMEPVDKPLLDNGACTQTVKCCEKKTCEEKEPKECEGCYVGDSVKDKCGCRNPTCKLHPRLEMCKAKVKYTVKVKVGDASDLASYSKLTASEKSAVPLTKAAVKVKITGACTPEQIDDPSVPQKECHVVIPAGALNKAGQRTATVEKVCENIGLVKTVEVENDNSDIAFVEDVVVVAPKDLSKPDDKKPITVKLNKFLGKEDPSHGNWKKVGPWKKAEEEDAPGAPGKKCSKCEELVMGGSVNCTDLHEGTCEPKACATPAPCGKCDYVLPYGDECDCLENNCIETITPDEACPKGQKPVACPEAPCPTRTTCCVPDPVCDSTPAPDPTCDQCSELAVATKPEVGPDGKPWPCTGRKCAPREECLTKKEAEELLNCDKCFEATESDKMLECGCKEWVCKLKKPDCKKCEADPCSECKTVYSDECKTDIATCVPKECKGPAPCTIAKKVNGKQEVDQCKCPVYENKPCNNDHAHVCEPGKTNVVSGIDGCGCKAKTLIPCDPEPECNNTCHELIAKPDGDCCKKYTCQKKECPPEQKKECPRCHRPEVHADDCGCHSSKCVKAKCPPVHRCPAGEAPVMKTDLCGCAVLLKCGQKPCLDDKVCSTEPVEVCTTKCIDKP